MRQVSVMPPERGHVGLDQADRAVLQQRSAPRWRHSRSRRRQAGSADAARAAHSRRGRAARSAPRRSRSRDRPAPGRRCMRLVDVIGPVGIDIERDIVAGELAARKLCPRDRRLDRHGRVLTLISRKPAFERSRDLGLGRGVVEPVDRGGIGRRRACGPCRRAACAIGWLQPCRQGPRARCRSPAIASTSCPPGRPGERGAHRLPQRAPVARDPCRSARGASTSSIRMRVSRSRRAGPGPRHSRRCRRCSCTSTTRISIAG